MAALPNDLSKVDPADAWKPWAPAATEPWDRKRIAHLFRRAAFGATPTEIDAALKDGFPKTLDRLLKGEPDAADRLELLTETGQFYTEPANLRVWWLYAMLEGGYPLREKLTLFWHNHFATSYAKVRSTKLMYEQNSLIRKHALGHFRPFLLDMSRDTAMLVWLDSNRNVKGAPNENYAREVMELFSLGVGNYTEKDVQEAARAFTGWHHDAEVSKFENNVVLHDDGEKTIFGKKGNWAGADVVRLCCDHEACARFLVGKLYAFLISETKPPAKLLEPLEASFRKSDYDIAALVGTMLSSKLFFSDHAFHKRVKWPVEYAVGAVRAVVPGRVPLSDLTDPLAKMGQVLFAPPNVKGWRTGTDWLNSATLLARNNFAEKVAIGQWSPPSSRPRGSTFARVQTFQTTDNAAPKPPGPPPAPPADQDVAAAVFATNPKDIPAVVKRMGELLHGEPLSPKVAAKLEQFLRERGPAAAPATTPAPGGAAPGFPSPVPPETATKTEFIPPPPLPKTVEAKPLTPAPMPHKAPPFKPDLASDDFKARVREAIHAMMCLPEYQLN
ncbi:MAG: DUF1800 domain-containing protein [Planctomycetes bacterium]|nr:DUF1800 domain-containing protein [Planctomycetota bacterium]